MNPSPTNLTELYELAGPLVFRRCLKMLHDKERALDATQWVFLRAVEVGFEVRTPAESLSWLYRTATTRCLWTLRNERNRRRIRDEHRFELVRSTPSHESRTLDRDLLVRALEQLDDTAGELVLMTFLQGLSNKRAAEIAGVSTRTVIRARKRFQALVGELDSQEVS